MKWHQAVVAVLTVAALVVACRGDDSGGTPPSGGTDGGLDATSPQGGVDAASDHQAPASDASEASSPDARGDGASDAAPSGDAAVSDGSTLTDASADAPSDAPGPCATSSSQLAIVQTADGTCAFSYTGPTSPGSINLGLTPGWGTVCFAGSSGGCGTGPSADGWWFSGPQEIALCDATCTRFYNQTIAGKLTVVIGCPTQMCMH